MKKSLLRCKYAHLFEQGLQKWLQMVSTWSLDAPKASQHPPWPEGMRVPGRRDPRPLSSWHPPGTSWQPPGTLPAPSQELPGTSQLPPRAPGTLPAASQRSWHPPGLLPAPSGSFPAPSRHPPSTIQAPNSGEIRTSQSVNQ